MFRRKAVPLRSLYLYNVKAPINIVLKGRVFDLSCPLVMAILNVTPDSFYQGSRASDTETLKRNIERALDEGADILDIGGCSTRPGAEAVSEEDELERISTAFATVRAVAGDVPTSVDTFRASVARLAVGEFDCDIINDISAYELDPEMFDTVVRLNRPYVLTHSAGIARTADFSRASDCKEDDFLAEALKFFAAKVDRLRSSGFSSDIIIDPGFGFAKNLSQNYSLLRHLDLFGCFRSPVLAGLSRKSMIFRPLGITPDQALNGTTCLNTLALMRGANILRVHDVREAKQAIRLSELYNNTSI